MAHETSVHARSTRSAPFVYASGLGVVPLELDAAERCGLHRRGESGPLLARWAALARATVTTGGRAHASARAGDGAATGV